MAVRIRFDNTHSIIPPTFVLTNRSGKKYGTVPASNIRYGDNFNSYDELSFDVYKYQGDKEYHLNWLSSTNTAVESEGFTDKIQYPL